METISNNIQHIIQNQHGLAFVAVFIGGLISAASPCVFAASFSGFENQVQGGGTPMQSIGNFFY